MSIHNQIKQGRKRLGMTEQQFADACGVSRGAVQQWEKESGTAPTRKNQPVVAKLLGITVAQLMSAAQQTGGLADGEEQGPNPISLVNNPDYPTIRKVKFKLSAGATGFSVEYDENDDSPIVFQREWFVSHGYNPAKMFAARVSNGSMEPGLFDGDTIVINTEDTTLRDGLVFAMNYEGEMVVKRLVRDLGQWWLASDNPDKNRYPRKNCGEDVSCIGRVVQKMSMHI